MSRDHAKDEAKVDVFSVRSQPLALLNGLGVLFNLLYSELLCIIHSTSTDNIGFIANHSTNLG